MFTARIPLRHPHGLRGQRHRKAIKIRSKGNSREVEESRSDISVGRHGIEAVALGNSWASHHHGDIDVLFIWAAFTGNHSVLSNVVAVVGREEDVCIVEEAMSLKAMDDIFNQIVHCLE